MTTNRKPRTFKKIILEDLNRRGLGHIAGKVRSITYESFSMGNAVRVETVDLFRAERDLLKSILDEYAYGRFDAMTDYTYSEHDQTKERQAKYVTLSNKFSDPVRHAVTRIWSFDERSVEHWQKCCAIEGYDEILTKLEVT